MTTVELIVGKNSAGESVYEKIPAVNLEGGKFKLLNSPALAQGVAKGDILKIEEGTGEFKILKRGQNVCVQVYLRVELDKISTISDIIKKGGGIIDGLSKEVLVLTYPVKLGFSAIEASVNEAARILGALEWYFGNVYSEQDGVTPLGWWS